MLHSKTRVVKTYGKQRTRVVNVHQDFWDLQAEHAAVQRVQADRSEVVDSPARAARPVLASKLSQARVSEDDAEWEDTKEGKAGKDKTDSKSVKRASQTRTARGAKAVPSAPAGKRAAPRPVRDSIAQPSPTGSLFEDAHVADLFVKSADSDRSNPLEARNSPAPTSTLTGLSPSISPDSSDISDLPLPSRAKTARKKGGRLVTRARRRISSPPTESDTALDADAAVDAGLSDLAGELATLKVSTPPRATRNRRSKASEDDQSVLGRSVTQAKTEDDSGNANADGLPALLNLCEQDAPLDFGDFLESHNFGSEPRQNGRGARGRRQALPAPEYTIIKVGEATFSEVFAMSRLDGQGQRIIVKVVPLQASSDAPSTGTDVTDEIALSNPRDVVREVKISRTMSEVGSGFVAFKSAHVVKGSYPSRLLSAWDSHEEDFGSESSRPDKLPSQQVYALILLGDGGIDLEHFKFAKSSGWRQAAGIWWQVVRAVAEAEEKGRFEHRDLHEGQILIDLADGVQDPEVAPIEPNYCGLRATIVDFGLSRIENPAGGTPTWTSIPQDVYEGVGEQWDVYRRMRDLVADGDWSGWYPRTNIMWLHYLLRVILFSTESLRKPKSAAVLAGLAKRDPTRSPIRQRHVRACSVARDVPDVPEDELEERTAYASLLDLEQRLREAAGFQIATKRARGRGIADASPDIDSAQALFAWAEPRAFLV